MRGELRPVWQETWRHIWVPLAKHPNAPQDLFSELYSELVAVADVSLTPEALAELTENPDRAKTVFRHAKSSTFPTERAVVTFLERGYEIAEDLGGETLGNRYFGLVEAFLEKFSLRYDLRRPFSLHPTLSGVFSALMRELKEFSLTDADLLPALRDFEDALRDLKGAQTESKIKTCIQKQVNLMEALGQKCPGVSSHTLGAICSEVGTWPHTKLNEAMRNIYKFTCDYPGIRHAGTPASQIRAIEMKDMVSLTVLLSGFLPYLSPQHDAGRVFLG